MIAADRAAGGAAAAAGAAEVVDTTSALTAGLVASAGVTESRGVMSTNTAVELDSTPAGIEDTLLVAAVASFPTRVEALRCVTIGLAGPGVDAG